MKIYFDVCALGRLTDHQGQQRIRNEADAVMQCLAGILHGTVSWTSSVALREEVSSNPNTDRRHLTLSLLRTASDELAYTPSIQKRADLLRTFGFGRYDSLHVAFAEAAAADVLLTTDDRLIRLVQRLATSDPEMGAIQVEVMNPVDWLARRPR